MTRFLHRALLTAIILVAALPPAAVLSAASPHQAATAARIAPVDAFRSTRAQVIGFLPYWNLGQAQLPFGVLTTVAYFGVGTEASGRLDRYDPDGSKTPGWAGWTSPAMTTVIRRAHRAGARVVLSVQSFAWTAGDRRQQRLLLGTAQRRDRLARDIAYAVRARGADGVNLDFEPIAKGERAHFVEFVRRLRFRLDQVNRRYELTVDTTAEVGNYDVAALTARGAADAVVVMGYDYRTADTAPGAIAPLRAPGYDLADTIAAFRSRTSASKIILGLPWYGRAWSSTSKALTAAAAPNPAMYGSSVAATYETAELLASRYGRTYLAGATVAYTTYQRTICTRRYGCVSVWRKLFFDDARTLGAKLAAVRAAHLRGTAIWALGFEGSSPDLWRVYAKAYPRR